MTSIETDTVVVPVASESDAETTCKQLLEYLDPSDKIVAIHVIEKAGGGPDKASMMQREETAEEAFKATYEILETADRTVETKILYGEDIATTVFEAAEEEDASLIAFSPREASRLVRLFSGDVAYDLVTKSDRPVLVLPN